MQEHAKYVAGKAVKVSWVLKSILPRTGGPGIKARRVIASIVYSLLLYGAQAYIYGLGDDPLENTSRGDLQQT